MSWIIINLKRIMIYTKWFSIDIDRKGWYLSIRTKWGWYYILKEMGDVAVMELRSRDEH